MANTISKIDDESSSIDVPIRLISSEYYIKKCTYEGATNKALDGTERHKKAFNSAKQERDK